MRVVAEKAALRAQALALRAGLSQCVRDQMAGHLAATCPSFLRENLKRHRLAAEHPVVSVYHPIRGEADTLPLIEALARDGCKTALPVTVGRRAPLRFLAWRAGEPLRRGALGIAEPLAETEEVEPDVLFVPLAAFDGRGYRLGRPAARDQAGAGDRPRLCGPGGPRGADRTA
jgi:5-formyltetrahydrofolate cyclo-ligase